MRRFTIRDLLWRAVVMGLGCTGLRADEPGPTLKELIRQAAEEPTSKTDTSEAVRWAMSYHDSPKMGSQSNLLIISWFRGNVGSLLRYTVSETGNLHSRRTIYSYATQATHDDVLSIEQLASLRSVLKSLPESKEEPPIERTVLVSFQSGEKWRTETYDATKLPDEFEKVMLIIGERFETKDRREKKAK